MAATEATPASYDRAKAIQEFDDSKMGVKGLSESGITSIPRFFIHPPETLVDLKSSNHGTVPIIDLSGLDLIANRQELIKQVGEAARTWGFFQVVNHSVPVQVLDETINAIKGFHEQPHEAKAKYYRRQEGRGVMFASNNDLHRAEVASWHDSLQVWMAPEPAAPEEIPEVCRREVIAWDTHAREVADKVMELLCEGLGLEPGKFRELTFANTRVLVGHCYPYCPQPELTLGIKSHTDPGTITVLLQNRVPGLQVKHGDEWVDVNPHPGGLIINLGDFLQIVTNGEYKSVEHRVLANGMEEPRITVVEFFNLTEWRESGSYGPLPELVSPETPAIYRDFTVQEFVENFYSKGVESRSFIDKIRK